MASMTMRYLLTSIYLGQLSLTMWGLSGFCQPEQSRLSNRYAPVMLKHSTDYFHAKNVTSIALRHAVTQRRCDVKM